MPKPRKTNEEYVAELESFGWLVNLESYIDSRTPVLHKCPRHGMEGMVAPSKGSQGQRFNCCRYAEKHEEAKSSYPAKCLSIGKVKPVEEYVDSRTPIKHVCLEHGDTYLARPSNILQGAGLKCCQKLNLLSIVKERSDKAAESYEKRISEFSRVELVGEYKGLDYPVLHRCLDHGHVQEVLPRRILHGSGLSCCGKGWDGPSQFKKNPELAASPCHVYVACINGRFLKPGIARDPQLRRDSFYKSFAYVSPVLTREQAWHIEKALLLETASSVPSDLDPIYAEWSGRSELRLKSEFSAEWYEARISQLIELACLHGTFSVYSGVHT